MHTRLLLLTAWLVLSAAVQAQDDVRRVVERLKGKVEVDDKRKEQPIVSIDLSQTETKNIDLVPLAACTELEYLNLSYSEVGSAGLAHLARLTKLRELY